jgi:hypothetical protein
VIIMGCSAILVTATFLLRPVLCPRLVHHPDELARD